MRNNDFAILSLVAIVAIVGVIVLILLVSNNVAEKGVSDLSDSVFLVPVVDVQGNVVGDALNKGVILVTTKK